MNIYIVVGGPKEHIPSLGNYKKDGTWVGVDRGVYYLLQEGIIPTYSFGDFDSVTEEELQVMKESLPICPVPSEKDESDLELALNWALSQQPKSIVIFGATGGRLDHELSNIQLLLKGLMKGITIKMLDKRNCVQLLSAGTHELEQEGDYQYISFLPFTEKVDGMSLTGLKYTLENRDLSWGSTLCISNEFVGKKGTISFGKGIVIVVRSLD